MITIEDIKLAKKQIDKYIFRTDTSVSNALSSYLNLNLVVKYENRQHTGSFKVRGALNKLLRLNKLDCKKGVITMSAGNHSQGLAYGSKVLKIPSYIVMPDTVPFTKVRKTSALGSKVYIKGANLLESESYVDKLVQEKGYIKIHPYNDYDIISGQGTLMLEMLEDTSSLDILIVPVGGGGLLAGCSLVAKSINKNIRIIAVESNLFPSFYNKYYNKNLICGGATIAEGVAVTNIGKLAFPIINKNIDEAITVSEESIEKAISLLALKDKTITEGAGAIGLAALIENKDRFKNMNVGIILCGGNIDSRVLSSILMRDMIRKGEISTLTITMPDKPGQLSNISKLCYEESINILAVEHSRFTIDLEANSARLNITVETKDHNHIKKLILKINSLGYETKIISTY